MRVEVWCYSRTWDKWIRNIYTDQNEAQKRYERLKRMGKRVRPPQPVNTGLPMVDRVQTFFAKAAQRLRGAKRKSLPRPVSEKIKPPPANSGFHPPQ